MPAAEAAAVSLAIVALCSYPGSCNRAHRSIKPGQTINLRTSMVQSARNPVGAGPTAATRPSAICRSLSALSPFAGSSKQPLQILILLPWFILFLGDKDGFGSGMADLPFPDLPPPIPKDREAKRWGGTSCSGEFEYARRVRICRRVRIPWRPPKRPLTRGRPPWEPPTRRPPTGSAP